VLSVRLLSRSPPNVSGAWSTCVLLYGCSTPALPGPNPFLPSQ